MSVPANPTEEFADFLGSVPCRTTPLDWGPAPVWELGEGRAVVLLHGIAGGPRVLFRVANRLSKSRRVIVPALRGEESPRSACSLEVQLDDVARLLVELDLQDVTLFGFSFGGMLALGYGGRRDPRVTDVVVQGTFASFRLRPLDRFALAVAGVAPQALGAWYFRRRILRGREHRLLAEHAPGLEALNADWAGRTPIRTLRDRSYLIARSDVAEPMRRIDVPLTLARGTADPVVPGFYFDRLREVRPDARVVEWDGVGHLAPLTHPDEVARLVT